MQNVASAVCMTTARISATEERGTRSVAAKHTYQIPRSVVMEQLFCKREDFCLAAVGKIVIIPIQISASKER